MMLDQTPIYYVYFLMDPREKYQEFDGKPFYVGKGKNGRSGFHLKLKKDRNNDKILKIKEIRDAGFEPIILHYEERMTEDDAFALEALMVERFGRKIKRPNGILTNIIPGGFGVRFDWKGKKHSAATIVKMQNRVWTEITRKRLSKSLTGKKKTLEHRRNLSKARMGWKDSDATRLKKSQSHTGLKHTMEQRRNISKSLMGHVIVDSVRKNISKAISCTYKVTTPNNEVFEVNNLRIWAPEHNISYQCLLQVANGNKSEYKGWLCERLTRPTPTRGGITTL